MAKSIQQLLQEGQQELELLNIENAAIDTALLLGFCLQMNRTEMLIRAEQQVDDDICLVFDNLIKRRGTREPVAYILGEREFWSLPFWVNENVLIPRPETEFLLEKVLQDIEKSGKNVTHCVDLCSGSGVIGIVLALELGCKVTALDLSVEALKVTSANANRHGVENLVKPVCSDLFAAVGEKQLFSLIVSNPPYVRSFDIHNTLQPEVAEFEPLLALDGGSEGLDCIRRIAGDTLQRLEPGGLLFMEFGADQALEVIEIFSALRTRERFFEMIDIHKDYSGRDRVLSAKINYYHE